ncbi:MAG: glycosyl hydrolase [Phycisphaerae bacterium]
MKRLAVLICFTILLASSGGELLTGNFTSPTSQSGPRCWWWWLNGNVTKEAITKDLEAMADKGFSGAMLFDAGGAEQRGNAQVPEGPMFGSPAWRELYLHALHEANRLDLQLGLSIMSGWNLGGPGVTSKYAAKVLTWSEVQTTPRQSVSLPEPPARDGFYRDICVLAYKNKTDKNAAEFSASSSQRGYPADAAFDGNPDTFWVSGGTEQGQGPTSQHPEWLKLEFAGKKTISGIKIEGRQGYGAKSCRIKCKDTSFDISVKLTGSEIFFAPQETAELTILVTESYDPKFPDNPRNVQIAELTMLDENGRKIVARNRVVAPIRDLALKSAFSEIGMSAPDTTFLLTDLPATAGEEDVFSSEIIDVSDKLQPDGSLDWNAPQGSWTILRFGYTVANSHVSTSSGKWQGRVIDHLSVEAFDDYWNRNVSPLLELAGPLAGTVLTQLETDSWECGGMNWTPEMEREFFDYCGYDIKQYLPVIAGKIVDSREASNAFLADFRKTIGNCISENHYRRFAERADEYGIGIQPESAGPHAGPFDGLKNYSHSSIMMSEFWAPSPHRPTPPQRFFVKQAASAAHIYGKQLVGAESFTTIGRHWNDVLWASQLPSMNHEFCSGLNLIFFHTFTCSPKEMGLPGQEYFAGTHINPQVTWWPYCDGFMDYISRVQYVLQQGKFQADALYYYGDHVPNIFGLKESDPAGVLPGYDYDVTNEDVLLQLSVDQAGNIVTPSGTSYKLLALPAHRVLSKAALEKVAELLHDGATVLGEKPERMVSLSGGKEAQEFFRKTAASLWDRKETGKGKLISGMTTHEYLQSQGIDPDFSCTLPANANIDYIHYNIDGKDVYFVTSFCTDAIRSNCTFRVSGRQPQIWNPVTGEVSTATTFSQKDGKTTLPLEFGPNGSLIVVFDDEISESVSGNGKPNFPAKRSVMTIKGPWSVNFPPEYGGCGEVVFNALADWRSIKENAICDYSGPATYRTAFSAEKITTGKRYWIELANVQDVGIASVKLNGSDLGITWIKPFRIEATGVIKNGDNELEVTVVNSWRNRLISDSAKPAEQRITNTNIRVGSDWKKEPGGLLGPVKLLAE